MKPGRMGNPRDSSDGITWFVSVCVCVHLYVLILLFSVCGFLPFSKVKIPSGGSGCSQLQAYIPPPPQSVASEEKDFLPLWDYSNS